MKPGTTWKKGCNDMKNSLLMWTVFCLCDMCAGQDSDLCRWETLSAPIQSNVLSQLSRRQGGERMAVMRKSLMDIYGNEPSAQPISSEKLTHLGIMGVHRMKSLCNLYPLIEGQGGNGERDILVYRKVSRFNCQSPLWIPAEYAFLSILDHAYTPKGGFSAKGIFGWDEQFCVDLNTLPTERLISKYQLGTVFSNRVYSVRPGCLMMIDYPSPENSDLFIYKKTDGVLDPHFARERQRVENERQKALSSIRNHGILCLSREEASELVALVGNQWYLGDGSKHREMRRKHPWFLPVDIAHPKTRLGRDLKATIEAQEERTDSH